MPWRTFDVFFFEEGGEPVSRHIYLDFNASTPIATEVVEAMRPFLTDHYGNPSSLHWAGVPAKDAVERARGQVAGLLGCDSTEGVFTSGGSEKQPCDPGGLLREPGP